MKERILQHKLMESLDKFKENRAVECGSNMITYGELDRRSNYIAHWILNKGLERETFIGVMMEDKIELIVTIIGILKAGCVFVPLDSTSPVDRIRLMLDSSDTKYLFVDRLNYSAVSDGNSQCFLMEDLWPDSTHSWYGQRPTIPYGPEDKIYIYFTSGTTGIPRAMVGKNKSLYHFIDWEIETFGVEETCRISQFTSPAFDAYLRDLFTPLCAGGTICIPESREILMDAASLIDWVDETGLTLIHCVPSLFRLLCAGTLTTDHFSRLKYILMSGEKIEPRDLLNWFDVFGERIQLVNLWGTSETTLAKTCYFIQPADIHRERIPVGFPIKGSRVIVLDKDLNICEDEVAGELYIRTPFRTFGYYNDSELNRARFIRNPFNEDPNDLLHKTGDLGRLLPDGNIELIGRVDRQLKIRGIRIEPEEIESVIVKHPFIREAVVIKRGEGNNESLCAYFVQDAVPGGWEAETLIAKVKEFLKEKLPDYMVPSLLVKIDELPRKPNGKVDYEALTDYSKESLVEYIPPGNETEFKLIEFWKEILGIKQVGVKQDFFESGGNSLNVMNLINMIHKEFDVRISLADIFENLTVEGQARIIMAANPHRFHSIPAAEKREYYPLSSPQKRMYILYKLDPEGMSYIFQQFYSLEGEIDNDRLEKTFERLIRMHESLRSYFEELEGQPIQRLCDQMAFDLEIFDLSEEESTGTELEESIRDGFARPFDFCRPPLFRVALIKKSLEQNILMFSIHHIITDGTSQQIFVNEFMRLYDDEILPPLKIQYKDYAQWQNSQKDEEYLEKQEKYWLAEFSGGIPILDLPTDFERPPVQDFSGDFVGILLDKEDSDSLKKFADNEGVTLYILLLTISNVLFGQLSGQEDIVIGTDTAGRKHVDLEPIIGMFVNTLALRNFPRKDKTFREFLHEVKFRTLRAFENQEFQFEELVELLDIKRDKSRNPLFDIMFSVHNYQKPLKKVPTALSKLAVNTYTPENDVSKFDMNIKITIRDRIYVGIEYATSIFRSRTIEDFLEYFKEIVSVILKDANIKLEDIVISHKLLAVEADISEVDLKF